MRIKLDENLPVSLVKFLIARGHDVDTVQGEQLQGLPDPGIWSAAQQADRFLVTQDLDFSDARRYQPGTHCGLLLVRLHRPGRTAVFGRIKAIFEKEDVQSWARCLVVATEMKVRVLRP